MDLNEQKEKFSKAWVRAVAAVAGYAVFESDTDDDSIDLTIAVRGGGGTIRSPKVDVQIKCSGVAETSGDGYRLPLKLKNYDDLRDTNVDVPRVLVFVLVPTDPEWWLIQNSASALLRHSAYWVSLRGLDATPNSDTVTVTIPGGQQFTPVELQAIMARRMSGGLP